MPGVTKAQALAALCAELGLEASDVVAFGDMPNDSDMLGWAGRGYVMGGGHPSLLDRFPHAGSADTGGVGSVLRRLLADA